VNRISLAIRIADGRPAGVAGASLITALLGVVGAHALFLALAPYPHSAFPILKPVAVLGSCAAVAMVALGLAVGLMQGRLGAWFGAYCWALLNVALPALMIRARMGGGLSLRAAIALTPSHAALIALASTLLYLLWGPRVRAWFAAARRLRALSPGDLDRYLWEPGPRASITGETPSGVPARQPPSDEDAR
jgi:hypothetical protein